MLSAFQSLPCAKLRTAVFEYDRRIDYAVYHCFDHNAAWIGNVGGEEDSEAIVLREKLQAISEGFERKLNAVKRAMGELNVSRQFTPPEMNIDSGFIEVKTILCEFETQIVKRFK